MSQNRMYVLIIRGKYNIPIILAESQPSRTLGQDSTNKGGGDTAFEKPIRRICTDRPRKWIAVHTAAHVLKRFLLACLLLISVTTTSPSSSAGMSPQWVVFLPTPPHRSPLFGSQRSISVDHWYSKNVHFPTSACLMLLEEGSSGEMHCDCSS